MARQRERILDYLRAHPHGADDDVLASALGVTQRQAVNQVCRQLAGRGVLTRHRDPIAGKIINRLADVNAPVPAPATSPLAATNRGDPVLVGHVVALDGDDALRRFAYAGEVNLTEDQVKQAVETVLQREGWQVDTRWGRAHGIDIEARRDADRLVLEAKGEGSRQPMRVNFFLGALGELLQRMGSPDTSYGLALPAHRQYAGLLTRLPARVRERLNLRFYLVRPTPAGYQVGLVSSNGEAALIRHQGAEATAPAPTLETETP